MLFTSITFELINIKYYALFYAKDLIICKLVSVKSYLLCYADIVVYINKICDMSRGIQFWNIM